MNGRKTKKRRKNCFLNNINYSFITDMEPFRTHKNVKRNCWTEINRKIFYIYLCEPKQSCVKNPRKAFWKKITQEAKNWNMRIALHYSPGRTVICIAEKEGCFDISIHILNWYENERNVREIGKSRPFLISYQT